MEMILKLGFFINSLGPILGVPPELIKAVIWEESVWDERAISSVGAKGLMQLMPIAVKDVHQRSYKLPKLCQEASTEFPADEDYYTPEWNIVVGGCYLKLMIQDFDGDVRKALHAYQGGGTRVRENRVLKITKEYAGRVLKRVEDAE